MHGWSRFHRRGDQAPRRSISVSGCTLPSEQHYTLQSRRSFLASRHGHKRMPGANEQQAIRVLTPSYRHRANARPLPFMPDPVLTLSDLGESRLAVLARALEAPSTEQLRHLLRLIEPHKDLPGLHYVVPRLVLVMPWMQLLAVDPKEPFDALTAVARTLASPEVEKGWADAIPRNYSTRANITNALTSQLSQYPHYGLYTEFRGDRTGAQEARVAPLIALFTLLKNAQQLSQTAAKDASRLLRQLLNPLNDHANALRAEFETVPLDVESAWTLFSFARHLHTAVATLVDRATRVAVQARSPPRRRPTPAAAQSRVSRHGRLTPRRPVSRYTPGRRCAPMRLPQRKRLRMQISSSRCPSLRRSSRPLRCADGQPSARSTTSTCTGNGPRSIRRRSRRYGRHWRTCWPATIRSGCLSDSRWPRPAMSVTSWPEIGCMNLIDHLMRYLQLTPPGAGVPAAA